LLTESRSESYKATIFYEAKPPVAFDDRASADRLARVPDSHRAIPRVSVSIKQLWHNKLRILYKARQEVSTRVQRDSVERRPQYGGVCCLNNQVGGRSSQ